MSVGSFTLLLAESSMNESMDPIQPSKSEQ
jgi:hypothetical protein